MKKKFVVIDGSSLLYRAFYALPLLSTTDGQYTNAIYGFANMLVKLIADLQPDAAVVAFDKGKKTFRNQLYVDYKGTRKPTPPELSMQIPLVHSLVAAFGIKLIEQEGYEADDIIGTLATKAAQDGDEAIIVTGDRDALQLISDGIKVMLTKKGISETILFDRDVFKETYGLEPSALIDLKGLMGDTSDNIPGVPGVGEKTATKLLLEYGTMENVLDHIEDVSGKKLQENLRQNRDKALLSKQLATIVCDMDLQYGAELYEISPNLNALKSFCRTYAFKSVLARLDSLFPQEDDGFGFGQVVEVVAPEYEEIVSLADIESLMAQVRAKKVLYFYPLVSGTLPQVTFDGIMLVLDAEVYYINNISVGWNLVLEVLADVQIEKVSYDIKPLYQAQVKLAGHIFDLMMAAYLLEPSGNSYHLNKLMETYLQSYDEPHTFADEKVQAAWSGICIVSLYPKILDKVNESGLMTLYENIEFPLIAVLASMESTGIKVDLQGLRQMSDELAVRIDTLLQNIYDFAGESFNVNSTKQLGEILFEKLKLPVVKKTKRGYSTDAEVLETLLPEHPIIAELLEYRTLTKLKSTYLDGLEPLISKETGRIYTSFNQMVTATGRLSSSEPNLQNIPVRTALGKKIRALFVPGDGYDYFLSADYSQIELRVLAHMSEDKNFVEAFSKEQDIHTRTAAEVFSVAMEDVDENLRRKAKAVNFGIVYGISDYGLSKDLGISRKEAGEYIANYFAKCSGVKSFIDTLLEKARQDGFVETLFGRRRALPEINSTNYNQRSIAERMAMNTPIQGTAADIIKKAMVDVYHKLIEQNLKSRILLQVHDELVIETIAEETKQVESILRETMPNAAQLKVPLTIDVHMGQNWAQAK